MATDRELQSTWQYISNSVERIVASLDGLSEEDLNWKPLESANSLYVFAIHVMANVEDNILGTICGQSVLRKRDEEFRAHGSEAGKVRQRWQDLKAKISKCIEAKSDSDLQREYEHHGRGKMTGLQIMVVTARHAAEHMGQAELTMDLLTAARRRPPIERDAFGTPVRK